MIKGTHEKRNQKINNYDFLKKKTKNYSLHLYLMNKSVFYINIPKNSCALPPRRLTRKHTFTSKLNSKDRHITQEEKPVVEEAKVTQTG